MTARLFLALALVSACLAPAAAAPAPTPVLERDSVEVDMTTAATNAVERSLIERIARDPVKRVRLVKMLGAEQLEDLTYLWAAHARPKQLAPAGNWRTWLVLAGRGFGKTRTGAEWIREQAESGRYRYLTLIGPTADDVRDAMVEGQSGILAVSHPKWRPEYQPSKRRLVWPNGARGLLLTADEPDRARGKQHEKVWADEVAAWRYRDAWDQTMLGLRLGDSPQVCATTTPRPTPLIRELVADAQTVLTHGTTYENRANLAQAFVTGVISKYEGTRLGRQELDAEILDDVPGALWTRGLIEKRRVREAPELKRVVVAIDPAVTASEESDETGIVVAGVGLCGCKDALNPELHGFVLEDLSGRLSPNEWGQRAVAAYRGQHADRIVAEENNGGKLVEANIRTVDRDASYRGVRAAQGKRTRAEPVAALYEQGRVHHVGAFPKLEDQLATWDPLAGDRSPDRLDALVWAITDLMLAPKEVWVV